MKKNILIAVFIITYCLAYTQENDCFFQVRMLHESRVNQLRLSEKFTLDLNELNNNIAEGDIEALQSIGNETRKSIVGCEYPDQSFIDIVGNNKTIHGIKSKFVIIHFNDLYTDICERELDSLIVISKDKGESVTIISFFPNSKTDIQHLVEKYGKTITFVADSSAYISAHNLGQGSAFNYLLDQEKHILYASIHCSPTEFKQLMKME